MTDINGQFEGLRSALAHLNDPAWLEAHPLATRVAAPEGVPELTRGQLLRRTLRMGIEALDPGPRVSPSSPEARPYHVLHGRYIAGQSIQEVAAELDISERQAYRELRRGVAALAELLRGRFAAGEACAYRQDMPSPRTGVSAEVARLSSPTPQVIDLLSLLGHVAACVEPLAQDRGLRIQWHPRATALYVATQRIMLRQAILNLLSAIIGSGASVGPTLQAWEAGGAALVRILCPKSALPEAVEAGQPYAVANQLLESLALNLQTDVVGEAQVQLTIRIPLARERKVLVVDDNPGLVRLFERYLEGHPYLVHGITDGREIEGAVSRFAPDVVIIDVMMREMDGWEVLQALRRHLAADNRGDRPRIIVCSIINDPELALSLGADGFLHKPVNQARLLHALSSVL